MKKQQQQQLKEQEEDDETQTMVILAIHSNKDDPTSTKVEVQEEEEKGNNDSFVEVDGDDEEEDAVDKKTAKERVEEREQEENEEEEEGEQEEVKFDLAESGHKEDARAILEALRGDDQEEEEDEEEDQEEEKKEEEEQDLVVLTPVSPTSLSIDSFWKEKTLLPTPPNQQDDHSIINVLTEEMLAIEDVNYLEQFELLIPNEEVVVGTIPLEEIHQKEIEIEKAKEKEAELQYKQFLKYQQLLETKEKEIHQRLLKEVKTKHLEMLEKKRQFLEMMHLRSKQMKYCFLQAEKQFKTNLQLQKVKVQEVYGQLEDTTSSTHKKRYRLEWQEIPLTIQIQARCLRGLKEKSPKGHYVVLTTLYDRLGGHPIKYTKSQQTSKKNCLTRPFYHTGRFYDTQVNIQQKMFVTCPPTSLLRPGQVLIFELFVLCGRHSYKDQVIAWGALPLCTPDFQVLEGSYKIPLIRGEMDTTIDKYVTLEQMIQQDLTAWLCHLYVDIQHMEKTKKIFDSTSCTKKVLNEYDVEIDQMNQLLKIKSFERQKMFNKKKNNMSTSTAGRTSTTTANTSLHLRKNTRQKHKQQQQQEEEKQVDQAEEKEDRIDPTRRPTSPTSSSKKKTLWKTFSSKSSSFFGRSPKVLVTNEDIDSELTKPLMNQQQVDTTQEEDEEEEEEDKDNWMMYSDDDDDDDDEQDESTQMRQVNHLDKYTFSINKSSSVETAQHKRFHMSRKLFYLQHELLMDLGFNNWHLLDFWIMLGLLVFALWLSMYIHYIGQWVFLKSSKVPVYDFIPQLTTCLIKYTWKTIPTHTEIGLIVMGSLSNWFLFGFMALIATICQKYIGELPSFGSKFIVCIGIASILDPLLIFLLDLIHQHYDCSSSGDATSNSNCVEGDGFKLYTRFLAQEGSGIVGILLTLILYSAMICVSTLSLYIYLLYCHMNGRMLDVYRRIHQHETGFFVPHDLELSLNELRNICQQAKRWKGPKGTIRKVFIHEYLLQDPLDPFFQEKSVHIVIYTMHTATFEQHSSNNHTTKELYRHFIKSSDGSIIELFGEMNNNKTSTQWEQTMNQLTTTGREGDFGGGGFLNAILKDCYEEDLGSGNSSNTTGNGNSMSQLFDSI